MSQFKLQYRSSEAPTHWGIIDIPEAPDKCIDQSYCSKSIGGKLCNCELADNEYRQALKLALKKENCVPIQLEDQEKVTMIYYKLENPENLCGWRPDESKLYDILDGMEYELFTMPKSTIRSTDTSISKGGEQFYALKSKVEDKTSVTVEEKPLSELFQSPKRWMIDAELENGNYVNKCSICGFDFIGHKRRVVCHECHFNSLPIEDRPEEKPKEETLNEKAT